MSLQKTGLLGPGSLTVESRKRPELNQMERNLYLQNGVKNAVLASESLPNAI